LVVGVIRWQLSIPGCRSLKEKRRVVKSLKERVRNRFNVSVAETDHQDVWTRAELTVAVVAGDRRQADSMLDRVDQFVESDGRALIVGTVKDLL
jgi:hypothetical protein